MQLFMSAFLLSITHRLALLYTEQCFTVVEHCFIITEQCFMSVEQCSTIIPSFHAIEIFVVP